MPTLPPSIALAPQRIAAMQCCVDALTAAVHRGMESAQRIAHNALRDDLTARIRKLRIAATKPVPGADGYSEASLNFADWFRSTLAPDARLSQGWREKWARIYSDLILKDQRTREQIHVVCKWARSHEFWRSNFLSPAKLRQRDKAGALYFDRWAEAMRAASPAAKRTGQYEEPVKGKVL